MRAQPQTDKARARPEAREPLLVSVVIPAYNCEDYVAQAIDSVLAQTFADYEIIVVNDAATDDTDEVLRGYEESGEIRVVRHEENRGLAAARNSGIRAARGEYVTFLDADDLWRPERLEYHVGILRRHPELAFLSNRSVWFRDGERVEFPPLPEKPELRPISWQSLVMGASPFSASNAIVRRECLEEVGLFDEDLRAAEDRDLWIRLAQRFGATQAGGVVSAYRRHGRNMTADPEHMKRNMKRVMRKAFRRLPAPAWLRGRAYAWLYLDVAITCYEADRRLRAFEHLLKSLLCWPMPMGRQVGNVPLVRWLWAGKIALGRKRFERWWEVLRKSCSSAEVE